MPHCSRILYYLCDYSDIVSRLYLIEFHWESIVDAMFELCIIHYR